MPNPRYAIVDIAQSPARVLDVVEVMPDETFHPPVHLPGIKAVAVPAGAEVSEGDTWDGTGFKAAVKGI